MVTRRIVASPPSPSTTASAASTPVSVGAVIVAKKCPAADQLDVLVTARMAASTQVVPARQMSRVRSA
jgi:hypothetical protein